MTARHRLLVIEDDPDTAEAFAIIFAARGFDVTVASNGADALAILGHDRGFCAILLDLMLPVMDGRNFRRVQCADPGLAAIPVIVVSGDPQVAAAARQLHAETVLRKPFDPVEVVRAVAQACDGRACVAPALH